jgi:sigma-E factor negative regulatory protein RseC
MQQEATVKRIEGRNALIEVKRKTACGGDCDSCHGCPHPEETISVMAHNDAQAAVGDRVIVESSSATVLKLAVLVYVMPIVLMAAGYLVMPGGETARVLAGLAALACGLAICFFVSRRMNKRGRVAVHITQIL